MPFKVVENPTFLHEVKVSVPVDGGFQEQKLSTRFRVVDREELKQLEKAVIADDGTFYDSFLEKAVVTFEDLVDANDQKVPCSPAMRSKFLATPYIRTALISQYTAAMRGEERKN